MKHNGKNKKISNNNTLKAVIITSVIWTLVSGIGVVALTLYADDIIYNPANTNWKIDNAESALNDLYVLTNNKLTENYNNGYNAGLSASNLSSFEVIANQYAKSGGSFTTTKAYKAVVITNSALSGGKEAEVGLSANNVTLNTLSRSNMHDDWGYAAHAIGYALNVPAGTTFTWSGYDYQNCYAVGIN